MGIKETWIVCVHKNSLTEKFTLIFLIFHHMLWFLEYLIYIYIVDATVDCLYAGVIKYILKV